MSRVGKNPVAIPQGVTVEVAGGVATVKGKLGTMKLPVSSHVSVTVEDGKVSVKPLTQSKDARMMWGTTRANLRNLVTGVSTGYTKNLEINGVGYRASVQGKNLQLQLGFSHDVLYPIPEGITIKCDKPTSISITGFDRQRVGQVAAEIRGYKRPEPYKGKGIKYDTETILRKEGKKK
ncbi:50S ribosomal protein L6 [Dongia soli]|uniref:Large ribosomal subunit protein uL6 n=1 Tax=Dongia soli TaxID=600628 RepID=A0ABU5EI09_9PROT|nr:50S ribosomal protein L6 [Dongia soli]MDY0885836.1 50S ribosomal protein L6 [Dongia soli]